MSISHVIMFLITNQGLIQVPHEFSTVAECKASLEAIAPVGLRSGGYDAHGALLGFTVTEISPKGWGAVCLPVMEQ